jgi:hypothetical protein
MAYSRSSPNQTDEDDASRNRYRTADPQVPFRDLGGHYQQPHGECR